MHGEARLHRITLPLLISLKMNLRGNQSTEKINKQTPETTTEKSTRSGVDIESVRRITIMQSFVRSRYESV